MILYITVDPDHYLKPGKDAAQERIAIKRSARTKADHENYDSIVILSHQGIFIEEVSTIKDITGKSFVVGYDVNVITTSPGIACDHIANLDRADRHGEVMAQTNTSLTLHISNATRLDKLRHDPHFKITKIKTVKSQ